MGTYLTLYFFFRLGSHFLCFFLFLEEAPTGLWRAMWVSLFPVLFPYLWVALWVLIPYLFPFLGSGWLGTLFLSLLCLLPSLCPPFLVGPLGPSGRLLSLAVPRVLGLGFGVWGWGWGCSLALLRMMGST